jgi:hypothetical protein
MEPSVHLERCVGCGALVPRMDGPSHPYIGASPGCWAIFGEILAKEYGEWRYPPVHRLTVDAYAVQHPGTPSRRSIQSVAIHLITLFLTLERGYDFGAATRAMGGALRHRDHFVWLEPPPSLGEMTVLEVRKAGDLAEHAELVYQWAGLAWEAWSTHHGTVRRWAEL